MPWPEVQPPAQRAEAGDQPAEGEPPGRHRGGERLRRPEREPPQRRADHQAERSCSRQARLSSQRGCWKAARAD